MKNLIFSLGALVFVLLMCGACFGQELPKNFEQPWVLKYQGKWIVQNTTATDLVMDFPHNATVRYCAGEIIPLSVEYAENRGTITFEATPDQKSTTGVRYEIREIQILCE
ncbi:hypothetical protein MASR1M90_00740 [Desulfovibrionales bacterium]